jgi:hypothetical protein
MFGLGKTRDHAEEPKELLHCSFCRKSQDDVRTLIAGPTVFICDECVQICVDIINHDAGAAAGSGATPEAAEDRARAAAERMNRDRGEEPRVDLEVPSWHLRCPLCEMVVPTDDAIPIAGRGVLCRPCVLAIRETPPDASES